VRFRVYGIFVGENALYIGLTQRPLGVRRREHLSRSRGGDERSPFHQHLREHVEAGHCIAIRLLSTADTEFEAAALERFAISAHPEAFNVHPGGGIVSDTHAIAIADALRGRRRPALTRMRIAAGMHRAWRRRRGSMPTEPTTTTATAIQA
jgi:hypothetical protein